MTVETAVNIAPLERLVTAGVLLMLRVGSAVATAPVFSSTAVPVRVKAVFTLVVTILLVPVASAMQGAMPVLSVATMLSETAVGLCFGLTLALLTEALLFAGSLMGVAFSFSLVNLMDPNSHVETDVLGTIFGWLGVLVLVSAGPASHAAGRSDEERERRAARERKRLAACGDNAGLHGVRHIYGRPATGRAGAGCSADGGGGGWPGGPAGACAAGADCKHSAKDDGLLRGAGRLACGVAVVD